MAGFITISSALGVIARHFFMEAADKQVAQRGFALQPSGIAAKIAACLRLGDSAITNDPHSCSN